MKPLSPSEYCGETLFGVIVTVDKPWAHASIMNGIIGWGFGLKWMMSVGWRLMRGMVAVKRRVSKARRD